MIIIQMKHNLTFCMACDFCQCCFTFLSAIHCFENSNICLTYDYKNYSILLLKWKRHFRLRITNPREASVKSSKISALWKRYSTIVLWAKEKHHCGFPSHSVKEMIFRSTKKRRKWSSISPNAAKFYLKSNPKRIKTKTISIISKTLFPTQCFMDKIHVSPTK